VGFRVAYAGLSLEVQTPMSRAHMQFRSQIGGQQAVIFDLVADLNKWVSPFILGSFRKENIRTLACLKRYAER
jgi:hypothetical protein